MSKSMKQRGEDAACAFLERVGICVIERKWSCDAGTIDVLGWDGDQLVLVDVKTVRSGHQGGLGTVSAAVSRRIKKVASAYIEANDLGDITWRFDRVSLLVISEDRALLRHHRNALASGE